MKYFMLMLLFAAVSSVSAMSDPFQYRDTLHGQATQIIKFNKNNKPHSKFFGREKMMIKKGISGGKKRSKEG
ncbi:hypothetical protein [Candidatus Bodocaedibacter vickermanii]|uniref:Uncharacterized protein n=1 Tax=Candidatus Bodocaedibacter vickermanii TaxID=2741701 RepID=A0A7L9RS95_9PROT|nr:hypothetical protein CPBP_00016 [Candidatus Paracaedibacteraceae bacterium 'Lake Konstanz']